MKVVSKFLNLWLSGTTCVHPKRKHEILFENDEWIILKHYGHMEYCGRWLGNLYCETYCALYNKEKALSNNRDFSIGDGFHYKWTGRTNRKKIIHDCEQRFKIVFPNEYQTEMVELIEYVSPEVQKLIDGINKIESVDGIKL